MLAKALAMLVIGTGAGVALLAVHALAALHRGGAIEVERDTMAQH
jgi:hypothetical protein